MSFKVGIYCRKSSGVERDNISLKIQKEEGIKFCKNKGFDYIVHSEIVSGGEVDESGEYNRMVKNVEDGNLKGIWVFKYDRLERNMESYVRFRKLCIEYSLKFWVGIEEYNLNDSGDRLNVSMRSMFGEYERERIKERMVIGKERKLSEGKNIIGNVGYGYKRIDGEILINEDEGRFVKDIYKIFLYKNVSSYNDVLVRLRKKKYYNERVGRSLIVKVLNNERYLGKSEVEFNGKKYVYRFESLVTKEDYNLVKDKIKYLNSKRKRKDSEGNFLLKGKIFCKDCEDIMWVIGSRNSFNKNGDKKFYRYYCCNKEIKNVKRKWNNIDKEDCCNNINRNKISVERLEKIVWKILYDVLNNSEDVINEFKEKYSEDRLKEKEYKNKITYYKNKIKVDEDNFLKKLDILIKNDIDLDEKVKNDFKKKKLLDEKRIVELERFLEKLSVLDDNKEIIEKIKEDINVIFSDDSFKNRKRLLDKYVDSVYIRRKSKGYSKVKYDLEIRFKFGGKLVNNKKSINLNNGKLSLGNDKLNYILKNRDLYVRNLVYKNLLLLDMLFEFEVNKCKNDDVEFIKYEILK